jgi:hypothetical protein
MHSTPSDPHTTTGLAQGDLRLLHTPVAQRLLHAPVPARLAYTGHDQTPRVIPINFHWTGDELVMGAFPGTHKLPALRARPQVAVCIDTVQGPPEVLLLRGTVSMADVDGVLPEYAAAQRRVMGDGATAYLAAIDKPGLRMVRLGLRPTWVGVLDFQHRFPGRTPPPVLAALTQTR